jgi:hypothetical protein
MNLIVEVSDLNKEAKRAEKGVFLTVFEALGLEDGFLGKRFTMNEGEDFTRRREDFFKNG